MRCPRLLQGLSHDFRVAIRSLLSAKIATSVALLSLALGIGANTAIFSLVDSLIFRALPVAAPQQLALLSSTGITAYRPSFSFATFDQIRRRHLFESAGAFTTCCGQSTITIDRTRELVYRQFFSGDFFQTLGLHASLGRLITPADDVDGRKPDGQVVLISDRLWKRRFGGATRVIGLPLTVDHATLTIVGVLPADFFGLEVGRTFDIAMPLGTRLGVADLAGNWDADAPILNILVRRRHGQTLEASGAVLRTVQLDVRADSMPKTFNADYLKEPFVLEAMVAGTSALRDQFRRPLMLLCVVVALVLLVACANVANLLLARSSARRHELSVRVALGASRWRLARQLFVESFLLAAIGTAGGVLFAPAAVGLLVSQLSVSSTPVVLDVSLDWRTGVFTAAVMVATAALFGVAPALRATQTAPIDALKDRVTSSAERRGRPGGVADGLIVGQVALSLTLVVAAGLFIRTFEQLARVSLGFDRDSVLGVTVNAQNIPAADRNALYHRLARAAEQVPGVSHVGGSFNPPLRGFLQGDLVVSAAGTKPSADAERIAQTDFVTPGSFAAYGIALRAGRDFEDRDASGSQPVMIVNQAFARRFLPDRSAVGEALMVTARLLPGGDFPIGQMMIVGVVGDAVYHSFRERPRPAIYLPLAQFGASVPHVNFFMAIRSAGPPPAALERSVAAALTAVNPDLTLKFQPLSAEVDAALAQDHLVAVLAGFFGGLALLLAGLGLYGVTAHAVSRRRIELGIRMALGASPGAVVRIVLRRVAILVGAGVVAGALVSLWAVRFAKTLLYGVQPRDPETLVGAVLVLTAVATCAAALPAWRASRIDPAVTLREH